MAETSPQDKPFELNLDERRRVNVCGVRTGGQIEVLYTPPTTESASQPSPSPPTVRSHSESGEALNLKPEQKVGVPIYNVYQNIYLITGDATVIGEGSTSQVVKAKERSSLHGVTQSR